MCLRRKEGSVEKEDGLPHCIELTVGSCRVDIMCEIYDVVAQRGSQLAYGMFQIERTLHNCPHWFVQVGHGSDFQNSVLERVPLAVAASTFADRMDLSTSDLRRNR